MLCSNVLHWCLLIKKEILSMTCKSIPQNWHNIAHCERDSARSHLLLNKYNFPCRRGQINSFSFKSYTFFKYKIHHLITAITFVFCRRVKRLLFINKYNQIKLGLTISSQDKDALIAVICITPVPGLHGNVDLGGVEISRKSNNPIIPKIIINKLNRSDSFIQFGSYTHVILVILPSSLLSPPHWHRSWGGLTLANRTWGRLGWKFGFLGDSFICFIKVTLYSERMWNFRPCYCDCRDSIKFNRINVALFGCVWLAVSCIILILSSIEQTKNRICVRFKLLIKYLSFFLILVI